MEAQAFAGRAQGMMQMQAPWTDRTGNARQGLVGGVRIEFARGGAFGGFSLGGGMTAKVHRIVITLDHSMEYGKWLETVNGPLMGARAAASPQALADPSNVGNFAVIHPVAKQITPRVAARMRSIWSRAS
jgi:hypothetical protein